MQEDLTYQQLGALLKRTREGDKEAFTILYRSTVYAQLVQAEILLKNQTLAEEAVQESYLTLYRRIDEIHNPQTLVAFLNRATFLCCQNLRRVESRRAGRGAEDLKGLPDSDLLVQPEETALKREREAALRQAVSDLPERQRQAVVLKYYQGLPLQQVARQMGCSLSTAKRQLQLARKQLKRKMRDFLPVFFPVGWVLSRSAKQSGSLSPKPFQQIPLPVAVLAGTGIIGIAAAVAFFPHPEIIKADSTPIGGGAQITVQARGAEQLALQTAQGETLFLQAEKGQFVLSPAAPGPGTIIARGMNGRVSTKEILVGDGDLQAPQIMKSWDETGVAAVQISDCSGVDWATLSLISAEGQHYGADTIDESAGIAYLQIPDGQYHFSVCDMLGNRAEGPFRVYTPSE
ncbi:Sigma-K factor [Anaerotruncus sp. 2789STDY5834896]|uniref:Sigma-K factor n=1 Tax=uncultured Anaerotruncus sp. TaxID=905011 RepID=A0A1C6K551_9FIRM|nr:Sigma-K factor [uncultured Anaerotruncus sp.]